MISEVDICNLALSNIRAGSINSLSEASLQAQQCSLKYPILRDMMLREYHWGFGVKIETLAPRFDIDVFNWVYGYQYPSDCLYIENLILDFEQVDRNNNDTGGVYSVRMDGAGHRQQIQYDVVNVNGQKVIACNHSDLRAQYRSRVTDTSVFDPTFTQALAWLLASELAIPVVGGETGRQLRGDAYQIYQNYLMTSATTNANERFDGVVESEFVTIRN